MTDPCGSVSRHGVKGRRWLSTREWIGIFCAVLIGAGIITLWVRIAVPIIQLRRLLEQQHNDDDWIQSGRVIEAMGGARRATPVLRRYLRLPDWITPRKTDALQCLAGCGEEGEPYLVDALYCRSREVQWLAVYYLSDKPPASYAEALPRVVRLLREEGHLGQRAADLLAQAGERARPVLPLLRDELRSTNLIARSNSLRAIEGLGKQAGELSPSVAEVANDQNREIRRQVLDALVAIGPAPKECLPDLLALLWSNQVEVRSAALVALYQMGPLASEATDAVSKAAGDENPTVRFNALVTLGKVGPRSPSAYTVGLSRLTDEDPGVRRAAIRLLAGSGDGQAIEHIRRMLDDEDEEVRRAASAALSAKAKRSIETERGVEAQDTIPRTTVPKKVENESSGGEKRGE
jgi:HEAT repeat protein